MAFPRVFREFDVETSVGAIHGTIGGDGPPLLLLHGFPQTHLMWEAVAGELAERHTVVATDLRGYGGSVATPPSEADYSMRGLAVDQVEAMAALGFDRFDVAGHDRGGRCAYRMAIDHPDTVTRLAVLDIVPTLDSFERADHRFALGFWVWSFLAAPAPIPETLILGAPDAFIDHVLAAWPDPGFTFPEASARAYRTQFHDPARVQAICAQYRCAPTIDTELDRLYRPRRPITCPTLVLWSATGAVAEWYDPLAIWRQWSRDAQGASIPAGHFLPEEAPDLVAQHLRDFFH
ncbi:haloacetate dehalogenase [Nocardia tenerifensis]|uniref:Haloacetate dehalogenase n=1 Tax=Nocardia tenerifensis TaxID=228006 RepID=A0A318K3Y4_9NOCA|nr:alpha/beta hydrolase [Nocardia tenerifensis]PXX62471.1 haloacetate dehalogenase [Nocardia tenerifensis]